MNLTLTKKALSSGTKLEESHFSGIPRGQGKFLMKWITGQALKELTKEKIINLALDNIFSEILSNEEMVPKGSEVNMAQGGFRLARNQFYFFQ